MLDEKVETLLAIGEMSRRSGIAISALRFYEDQRLIFSVRSTGNQRRYPRHMLRRVALISVAKRLGLPLAEIRNALVTLPLDRAPNQEEWELAANTWKQLLEDRRDAIDRLVKELAGCIGCGCLSMKACTLLNPSDTLAQSGPGPRRVKVP